jgi:hypothetical protein
MVEKIVEKIEDKKQKNIILSGLPLIIVLIFIVALLFVPIFPTKDSAGKTNGSISFAVDEYNEWNERIAFISNETTDTNTTILGQKVDGKTDLIFSLIFIGLIITLFKIYKAKSGIVLNAFVSYMMLVMVSIIMLMGAIHEKFEPGVENNFAQSAGGNLSIGVQSLYQVGAGNPDLWLILCVGFIVIGFYYYFISDIKNGLENIKSAKQLLEEVSLDPDKYLEKGDIEGCAA